METIKSWYYGGTQLVFLVVIASACAICYFGLGFGLYQEKDEFYFEITTSDTVDLSAIYEPTQMDVLYIDHADQTLPNKEPRRILHFEIIGTSEEIFITLDTALASKINLLSGEMYHLTLQMVLGWPSCYGLMFTDKNDELVFLGISDWDLNGAIDLYGLSPLEIKQTRILIGHTRLGGKCYSRITNTEIQFSQNGKTIKLHQGQSERLNNYEIQLQIAQKVRYTDKCHNAGRLGLSFVAYKTLDATP
ncbi:MAG: hypothetical protein JNK32_09090 [Anaerolineales bacterium]|nr:hypothetical protein [Anaerolineales bacterium]